MSLLRGALTDENGVGDIAYISMGSVGLAVLGPIIVMTIMTVVAYFRCVPKEITVGEQVTVIACAYDPQPLGTAIGLACGGFGVALAALAGYMAATRPRQGISTTTLRETVVEAAPAPLDGARAKPVAVAVVDMPAATAPPVRERKQAKGKR